MHGECRSHTKEPGDSQFISMSEAVETAVQQASTAYEAERKVNGYDGDAKSGKRHLCGMASGELHRLFDTK